MKKNTLIHGLIEIQKAPAADYRSNSSGGSSTKKHGGCSYRYADEGTEAKKPRYADPPTEEEVWNKYGSSLWKVNKMKYMVNYMMCGECIAYNREMDSAPTLMDNGRCEFPTSLCHLCVKANCDFSSTYFSTKW